MSIPIGEVFPLELTNARECARAAVEADRAGEYVSAVDLYKKSVKRLLEASASCVKRDTLNACRVSGVTREAVVEMAEKYMKRIGELKIIIDKILNEQKKEIDIEEMEANYYSSDSDSYSDGERQTASRRKLSFRGAALLIMKLMSVPFGFKKAVVGGNGNKPQLSCKITKRDFLKLSDLTPLSATAVKPLFEMGQPHVLWASYVFKRSTYHRRFAKTKIDRRTAVVSPQAFYMGASNELVRCVPITDIHEVLISNDNWVGLRVPSQYDLLFQPQEQPIQSIATLLDILNVIYKYMNGTSLKVTKLYQTIDVSTMALAKPEKWESAFTPLRVDPLE